jgi:hypothetical protein
VRHRSGDVLWDRDFENHKKRPFKWLYAYRQWHLVEWTDEYISTNKQPSGYYRPPRTFLRHCICGFEIKAGDDDLTETTAPPDPDSMCHDCALFYRGIMYVVPRRKEGLKHRQAAKSAEKPWYDV